jgi:hypothetical protein
MSGWETVTAILGVVAIIVSAYVNIWKTKRAPIEKPPAISAERVAKLEERLRHGEQNQIRLQKDFDEARRRQDQVVDGIYSAIDDVRKMVFKIFESLGKE